MEEMNLSGEIEKKISEQIRVGQIIVAALASGCLAFAGIAVGLNINKPIRFDGDSILGLIALALAVGSMTIRFVLMRQLESQSVKRIVTEAPPVDESVTQLLNTFNAKLIIGSALLEGPCFFALIAYFIDQSGIALIIAAFLFVALFILNFPTKLRFETWLGDMLEDMRVVKEQQLVDSTNL